MSKPPSSDSWGVIALPTNLEPEDPEDARRAQAIAAVGARVAAGEISGAQADAELLEIALTRFDFLPPDAIDELRRVGRELNQDVEMVETRLGSRDGDEPRPSPWGPPPEEVE